ncbi:hypothetical protein BHE74_00013629 [Ensete ventricosum]|nr:hypothetical protein BHE74_00013629 [Ensete ventricosum]
MACLRSIVLGTDRAEESYIANVDGDALILDVGPAKPEANVVVNRIPEFDEDLMVLDDIPADEARWKLANEDREKGDHCPNATGVDIVAVENSSTPVEMVQDSSHVEAVRKCKAEVKDGQKRVKKLLKRKRASFDGNVNCDNKEILISKCQGELDELFEYHKEVSGLRLQLDDGAHHSNNMLVAYLLEESRLPFSKLVGEIYGALKGKNWITLASVRGTVLFVGQRIMYGISSADADVLEDESESSLWCWELLPITLRGIINIRRMARKKIHDRISALSGEKFFTSSMDCGFSQECSLTTKDLRGSYHWGVRCNPKIELMKELKLQRPSFAGEDLEKNAALEKETSSHEANVSEFSYDKLDNELESLTNNICQDDLHIASSSAWLQHKKLLQFCQNHRPAYYGTWRRKSGVVGPRHPFRKDPQLDYDVDSDEEWEEGVEMQISCEPTEDEAKVSKCCKSEVDSEESRALLQRQKILCNLTEKALRKSHPLVISNLTHEKAELLMAKDVIGTAKVEQICLRVLCMQAFPGGSIVDILKDPNTSSDDQQVCRCSKENTTQGATVAMISDLDLPEFVSNR